MRDAFRIKVFFVAKGHRFKRENRFTGLIHRVDLILELSRGDDRAELAVGPNDDSYPCRHSHSTDAGDKCSPLSSGRADADLVGLAGATTSIPDIDIITPRGEIYTG